MSLTDDARRFAKIPFLANLDQAALEAIAFASETKIVRRGETLFQRGDPADCAYVVLSGRLNLTDEEDRSPISIHSGSLIGEMSLLVASERRSTATAVEPSAVLQVARDTFLKVLRDHPASAVRLRDYCAKRLASFTGQLGAASEAAAASGNVSGGEREA
jgi:CRP-like cAMP-binding protein